MSMAKIINTEQGQAILLPEDYRLDCDEVEIIQRGDTYHITPAEIARKQFEEFLKEGFTDDFIAAIEALKEEDRRNAIESMGAPSEGEICMGIGDEQEQRKAI